MDTYNADHEPNPSAWLSLDEDTKINLGVEYHRRHHKRTPQVRLHATFHTIVENQLASREAAVVETLTRLRNEGLSRPDAIHAIGTVLAAQVYDLLKREPSESGQDPNEAYAKELRELTAESWRNAG